MGVAQKIPDLASIADEVRDSHYFTFMDKYHGSAVFDYQGGIQTTKHTPVTNAVSKLYYYLVQSGSRNLVLDTFSLVYLLHTAGEIFQPFHTTKDSGHKTLYSGSAHLHQFWDYTCDYLNYNVSESVKKLQEIEKTKEVKINNETPIKITLEEGFKKEFNLDNVLKLFKKIYERKFDQTTVFEQMMDPDSLTNDKYRKFCISIAIPNIIHSSWNLRAMLKKIYKNNKNGLAKSVTETRDVIVDRGNELQTGFSTLTLVISMILTVVVLLLIFFCLKFAGVIKIGFGRKKYNKKEFD